MPKKFLKHAYFPFILIGLALVLVSCGVFTDLGGNTQSSAKWQASSFVSKLYDKKTQTISLDFDAKTHVAWMALEQSGYFKYFKIDSYSLNGQLHNNSTNTSTEVFENITVDPKAVTSSSTSGIITDSTAGKLLVTITYNPRKALEKDDTPQSATLVVVTDSPKTETIRVDLNGFVKGICTDCHVPVDQTYSYTLKDNNGNGQPDFAFYFCDKEAMAQALPEFLTTADLPDGDKVSSQYAFSYVDLTGTAGGEAVTTDFNFYTSTAKEGFMIADAGDDSIESTLPKFDMPVIANGAPVDSISVEMEDSFQALCPYDSATGVFTCSDATTSGLSLVVAGGQVNISSMTMTTGEIMPTSDGCSSFGTWKGSGDVTKPVAGQEIVVVTVLTISNQQSVSLITDYGLDGALVVARMVMVPK